MTTTPYKQRVLDIIKKHNIKVDKVIGCQKDPLYPEHDCGCVWVHQNGFKYCFDVIDNDEHLEQTVITTLD